jgi:hypothetical protein
VDANGRGSYTDLAAFKNAASLIKFKAFPTVTHNTVFLSHEAAVAKATLHIHSIDGRLWKTIIPAAGTQQTTVDFSSLERGTYFVTFTNEAGRAETTKVIKL